MLATLPMILSVAGGIINALPTLIQLGRDVAPQVTMLKKLFSGEAITVDELKEMQARNNALNAEIEGQTEQG